MTDEFLPVCADDMTKRGISELDFVFVSGDAYVDHPSFAPALICRLLNKHGYKVGIIAQPNWRDEADFKVLGRPRLAFLVSAGNMDSMLNMYTAAKKLRHRDAYSPGGKIGMRPARATIVYTKILRRIFPDTAIIIGGIEASLRRFAHYDYWQDALCPSILADCPADLLVYGMGEKAIIEIAAELHRGVDVRNLLDIRGTAFRVPSREYVYDYCELPTFAAIKKDKKVFAQAFKTDYLEQDPIRGRRLLQETGDCCIVANPPSLPLTEEEMDAVYDLPYVRTWHPMYDKAGGVPALAEVEFGLVSQRGCFGGCSFCAIVSHEGRIIQRRSHASLIKEAEVLTKRKNFKGYIHDVGGPTANFRERSCQEQLKRGTCRGKDCLAPVPCKNLHADHGDYMALLRKLRALPKVKKVFVRSGVRFDYVMHAADGKKFLRELCLYHVSGHLKVAPEHISDNVTRLMGKPGRVVYDKFAAAFCRINEQIGKEQYLVPYFMSGHPGATLNDAVALAEYIRDSRIRPRQVQDFIPTPGTLSTAMFYSGINPLTGQKVFVAKTAEEKAMQRALLQYFLPANKQLVLKALRKCGREDLIGVGKKCLVRA